MHSQPVALVTGGSRGIGRGICIELARAGYAVAVNYAGNEEAARQTQRLLGTAVDSLLCRADVGLADDRFRMLDEILARWDRIDLLVNNAGITSVGRKDILEATEESWDRVLGVNLKGPLFLSTTAVNHLAADGGGSIVNIGALGASQPMEGIGAYCAVKAAMANWSTTMAREWASLGVRVNVLVPGSIATDMILPTDPDRRAKFVEEFSSQNVFGRLGEPEDLVGAAIFLASDASAYMTGRSVFVDGGLLR